MGSGERASSGAAGQGDEPHPPDERIRVEGPGRLNTGPTSVADYASILRRQKLLILPIVICVPIIAVAILSFQKPQFQALTDVLLLDRESLGDPGARTQPELRRGSPSDFSETQARLSRLPAVADEAIAGGGLRLSTLRTSSLIRPCPRIQMPTS